MALSAFGVDHGEISKAIPGMGAIRGVAGSFKQGVKGVAGPQKTGMQTHAMGAGALTRKAGQFGMKNKKPLGVGAGVGAAGTFGLTRKN